ncbi:MAG TPA: aminopeptidase P family N-terminal domain-containing protein, partial [Pirellulales bacterium]|nr:aminopeptidase P family N-terminal domain-containing protein [Pirellulales bacterium]
MNEFNIDVDCCRARQRRLLAEMRQKDLDLVLVQKTEHVQWLAGPRFASLVEAAAALGSDGQCTLVAPQAEPVAAADEIVTYEARWYSTLRNDQRQACSEALVGALDGKPKPRRIGVEGSTFGPYLSA